MFPVNVILDERPLTEFKEQDRAESVHYWSGKGREEEKHVLAARTLLEKEDDNGLVMKQVSLVFKIIVADIVANICWLVGWLACSLQRRYLRFTRNTVHSHNGICVLVIPPPSGATST